jgi:hypothetical protein
MGLFAAIFPANPLTMAMKLRTLKREKQQGQRSGHPFS